PPCRPSHRRPDRKRPRPGAYRTLRRHPGRAGRPLHEPGPPLRTLDDLIRRALAENRGVRAARLNVEALRHRIPQVTSLDDPMVSNTIFPIPSVAPQYSIMGYMPYDVMIGQQFPWFGTLRLRGMVADREAAAAVAALAEAELSVVAEVKAAYHDLDFAQKAGAILEENRRLATVFVDAARERFRTGAVSQSDVLRAEGVVADLDRERIANDGAIAEARADLARLTHDDPSSEFRVAPAGAEVDAGLPAAVDRLTRLGIAARPDLRGRLAEVERDRAAVELARKKYKPDVTLGVVYQQMERRNAISPTAMGMPNVGLFVGFNLPIYRNRLAAGVAEAEARAAATVAQYESDRDRAARDVKDALSRVRVQTEVRAILRETNLPRARAIFDAAAADFRAGNPGATYLILLDAWRDVLRVELQIAEVEAELGKALAALEESVGVQLGTQPIAPAPAPAEAHAGE
ncbi:MAG: TolC family protein, partial [Thermoleophilia bacterium]|nr:TolC family protein [Thermoleophilia bacterium]